MNTDVKLLKPAEVAARLDVSTDKVLQLIDEGKLKATRFGPRTTRIFPDSVDELIKEGLNR